jgi:hypothetical protein
VAFTFEKRKKSCADFVGCHWYSAELGDNAVGRIFA